MLQAPAVSHSARCRAPRFLITPIFASVLVFMNFQPVMRTFLVAASMLFLGACSDSRVSQLDESSRRTSGDIESLRATSAENTSAIADLRADLARLSGKLEELNYQVTGKTAELQRTMEAVSSRMPPPPGVPEDLLASDESLIGRISGSAADAYRAALKDLRAGKFQDARSRFSRFAEENPNTAFTDNAYFWMGICSDQLGELDRAVGGYSAAFQKFPAEDRAAPALYYLAQDFLKMKSRSDAIVTLQKLADDYGSTEYGRKGKALLNEMGAASKPSVAAKSTKTAPSKAAAPVKKR